MYEVNPRTSGKSAACGPVSLQMLLEYYGVIVDEETLIDECNTRIVGASASDLCRVARLHGLNDIMAVQQPPEELIRQDRPCIVWWRYVHWVVFCGQDEKGDVVICNPSLGRYTLDAESFKALCTGIEPGTVICVANGMPQDSAETPTPTQRVNELESAVVELAALAAEHDDAIVELAGLIEEG